LPAAGSSSAAEPEIAVRRAKWRDQEMSGHKASRGRASRRPAQASTESAPYFRYRDTN